MTDSDIIAAIRKTHLTAHVGWYEHLASAYRDHVVLRWDEATVDPGGTLFGPGPYVKLPVEAGGDRVVIRVYPPARLRRRLAAQT